MNPEPGPVWLWGTPRPRAAKLVLHAALLAATLLTTTLVGARMQADFDRGLPLLSLDDVWRAFASPPPFPDLLLGLPFSLTLLAILLAHEMGHYLACARYRLDASLPYFIPAPVLIGTFGAFIRIRAPLYSRRQLFDVAVAGPVAGFVFLLPALAIGLAWSKVLPGVVAEGALRFGVPPLLRLFEAGVFPGVPADDILLHPMARAAAIGMLATAWNLLPIGQLDGGHLLYALFGRVHQKLSLAFLLVLVLLGVLFWKGWLLWAALLFFLRRHPPIHDDAPLGPARWKLGGLAAAMFVLCFTATPIEELATLSTLGE